MKVWFFLTSMLFTVMRCCWVLLTTLSHIIPVHVSTENFHCFHYFFVCKFIESIKCFGGSEGGESCRCWSSAKVRQHSTCQSYGWRQRDHENSKPDHIHQCSPSWLFTWQRSLFHVNSQHPIPLLLVFIQSLRSLPLLPDSIVLQ